MNRKILAFVSVLLFGGFVTACSSVPTSSAPSGTVNASTSTTVHSFTVNEKSSSNMSEWSIMITDQLALAVEYFGKQSATDVTITLTPGGTLPNSMTQSFEPKQRKQLFNAVDFKGSNETVKLQITWTESGKQQKGTAEYELESK